ncbi:MAG TPA: VapE domain-containing protein, partial [Burkholderiaceae bacterium]|nr:VapE domain-containing protein [Burkholderiaceae bacterium]
METPHAGTRINFEELAARLASRAHELLPQWFPAGKFRGHEFVVGNLAGDPGESLSVNVDTGKWCDFATGEKGGDLISLYAAQHRVSQIEAARALAGDPVTAATTTAKPKPVENWTAILPVPDSAPAPPNTYRQQIDGQWRALTFVARWAYHDTQGRLLGYTVRFTDGKAKQIVPQTFCRNVAGRAEWKWKSFPVPRPLYGLARLAERPEAPVLVVEGEKSADAAHTLLGDRYVVVTWPGGCKALTFADWRYLYGRTVHLWPDADAEGVEAMRRLGGLLHPHCRDLKIIDTSGQPSGWDLADAQAEGWDWPRIRDWGRARAKPYEPADVVDLNEHRRRRPPAAVLDTAERPRFVSQHQLWDEFGLDLNGNGMPLANLNNALKLFEQHAELSDLVHFDEFHQKYFHRDGREWHDVDELNLAAWMQRAIGISRMPDDLVHKAAVIVARRRTRNEPRDWFDSLAWDGTPRIDAFFSDALGADDTDYTRAASRNFWVAIAARIYRPGCRMRNVPVLEGPQERGKSSALALIGGPWYTEASESVMSKDFLQVIQGKLIVEIAELEAFSRAEVARIKQVISNPVDRFRPPYARAPGDFRRQCVFVATTNLHEYLRDTTGGTRFWPIQISDIRLDLIADTRTQLFAEAVHAFKHG